MMIILAVTGVAVLLLLLETAVPYLRGSITLERDMENLSGETVCNHAIILCTCSQLQLYKNYSDSIAV